ncbi:MAG: 4Fe-4S binding protein [Dehalococcoidia bacterium]|nr:4Fe-4S binding protein [Dehalococcoidia bacterium]
MTCSAAHFGAVLPALSRIRVAKLEEIGIDMAVACISCAEKPCLVCPTDALAVGERGEIVLSAELCTACQECTDACPVGAVGFYEDHPLFCDLCDGDVSCVSTCPTDALSYVDECGASLEAFAESDGCPAEKRTIYVAVQGVPIRENWAAGRRVDS